ncbi:tetratricopeptide repeat protein [Halanaerobium hydrogeniformans]|uniref:Tetratricopeptide TPR_1 repeat-containing protein n=1 Tax=Halanaerobium hydrogeniformans TaxID=656519 RepID=E4RL99_HALHG|nr:tetratricopeptide repeat protein [Halanaerobium hydrogeniformans]ADQ15780.1 Tetratricopeptide TPR_1 repeat-containing protein [Halanaerobium hydrogeniformans]
MRESDYIKKLTEKELQQYQIIVDLIEKNNYKKAINKLEIFLDEKPDFVPALNKRAILHIYAKEYEKAENRLKEIIEIDRDFPPALTNLGSLAKKEGQKSRAKELYKKALDINPDYGPAYNNLGVIYREEGDYSQSVKYLKKARKKGSFNYKYDPDKAFYKDPGCIFILFLALAVALGIIFLI